MRQGAHIAGSIIALLGVVGLGVLLLSLMSTRLGQWLALGMTVLAVVLLVPVFFNS